MDVGHFSYLLSGPQQTKIASDRLELLANTAAKRYLEEQVPLNQTIRKIAEENDLNSNQVERVCEMANIATHRGLWSKTAEKETVEFPVADAKAVVQAAKSKPAEASSPCPGGIDSDYAGPPKGIPAPGPSILSMMGADPDAVHNGLHEESPKKRLIIILQKKAAERQRAYDDLLYKTMELEGVVKQAYSSVKQSVLGGETFRDLFMAATAGGLGKIANEYLPVFQDELYKEAHGEVRLRMEKTAIAKAPEELISDDMGNVAVINGAHPVMISLDTVRRKTGEVKNGVHNVLRIDDEIKVNEQKLKALS